MHLPCPWSRGTISVGGGQSCAVLCCAPDPIACNARNSMCCPVSLVDKAMWKGENSLRSPMAQHALVYKCCTYACEMLQPLLNAAVPSGTILAHQQEGRCKCCSKHQALCKCCEWCTARCQYVCAGLCQVLSPVMFYKALLVVVKPSGTAAKEVSATAAEKRYRDAHV